MMSRKRANYRADTIGPGVLLILILPVCLLIFFLTGCLLMEEAIDLTVTLPLLPENLRREIAVHYFLITYFDAEGMEVSFICPPEKESVKLKCLKQNNMPVTVQPVICCGEKGEKTVGLFPAGGIYPLDAEISGKRVVLNITWKHGFTADIFRKLYKQNVAVRKLNLKRFYYEMDRLTVNNPWFLDEDYIMEKLAGGSFRVTYLKEKPVFPFEIPVKSGQWVINSYFSQIYTADSASGILKLNLTSGFYTLIELKDLKTVDIFVSKTGDYEYADYSSIR